MYSSQKKTTHLCSRGSSQSHISLSAVRTQPNYVNWIGFSKEVVSNIDFISDSSHFWGADPWTGASSLICFWGHDWFGHVFVLNAKNRLSHILSCYTNAHAKILHHPTREAAGNEDLLRGQLKFPILDVSSSLRQLLIKKKH